VVRQVTGRGKHKQTKRTTVTIGAGNFTGLPAREADTVSLSLSRRGMRLLEQSGDRLNATVTTTVPFASTSQQTSAAISLDGPRPRKK
jgi:hypothetical protein